MQLAALGTTLVISIVGGLFSGYVCSFKWFKPPKKLFLDSEAWNEESFEAAEDVVEGPVISKRLTMRSAGLG